jgi:TatD DNase family protein
MIDAHCHLDFEAFDADREVVIGEAIASGISGFLVAGVSEGGWTRQEALAAQHPELRTAFGLHPWEVAKMKLSEVERQLAVLAGKAKFAVGETGLDRTRHCPEETFPLQELAFRTQLALARDRNLPVILHIVRAHGRALEILRSDGLPDAGGMVHSFSGSPENAEEYQRLGLYISISASISRMKPQKASSVLGAIHADRLLVETDCPDQPPKDRGVGVRNLPLWLHDVVASVSTLGGSDEAHIAQQTRANMLRLFPHW